MAPKRTAPAAALAARARKRAEKAAQTVSTNEKPAAVSSGSASKTAGPKAAEPPVTPVPKGTVAPPTPRAPTKQGPERLGVDGSALPCLQCVRSALASVVDDNGEIGRCYDAVGARGVVVERCQRCSLGGHNCEGCPLLIQRLFVRYVELWAADRAVPSSDPDKKHEKASVATNRVRSAIKLLLEMEEAGELSDLPDCSIYRAAPLRGAAKGRALPSTSVPYHLGGAPTGVANFPAFAGLSPVSSGVKTPRTPVTVILEDSEDSDSVVFSPVVHSRKRKAVGMSKENVVLDSKRQETSKGKGHARSKKAIEAALAAARARAEVAALESELADFE